MSEPVKFLVTGGAGFIGGNFVAQLLTENLGPVLVLDKFTYAGHRATLRSWEGRDDFRLVEGDIGDAGLVAGLLADFRPRYVVNFAAESHVDRSIDSAEEFVRTNVLGTFTLLDQALRHWETLAAGERSAFRLHHISTDEVFGSLGPTGAFSERTPYAPNSPYAASKAASDHLVRAYHRTHGLPVTITNCSNNYGPYQFPEKLLPLVVLNALEGKPIPVYGDGQNVRDWLHVDDHCQAILHVLAHGSAGETYNVGGRAERTNLDLLQMIFTALLDAAPLITQKIGQTPPADYRSLLSFVDDRPGHDRRYAIDDGKIRRELGWSPSISLPEGIAQTVAWYIGNLDWCREVQADNYGRERLGLGRQVSS